jgi:hypothetical protein
MPFLRCDKNVALPAPEWLNPHHSVLQELTPAIDQDDGANANHLTTWTF